MKKFIKNYKSSLILLLSMILGVILGLILKDKATYLLPLGNLFVNLLSTLIVPLLIVTISLAIGKLKPKKTGKLLIIIAITFLIFSLVSVFTGIIATKSTRLVNEKNTIVLDTNIQNNNDINAFENTINMLSVNDFGKLFSKDNMVAIIVFAILLGIAINITKGKKDTFIKLLEDIENILMSILKIIMYYAPIGICAFFASQVGIMGTSIATDYIKVFIIYTIVSILFALIFYSLIAFICGKNVKKFWIESIPVILTSLGTCSSAATLPVNIKVTNKLGISSEVSKTTTSLGTSFHKDGSVIDSVFKIMFLVYLFNLNVSLITIILISLLSTLLISAVPIGGGTMCEMLILTLLGVPISALPILTIIATITDAPATMLNSLGDTSASLLVNKLYKKEA